MWNAKSKNPSSTERESRIQDRLGLLDVVGNQRVQNEQTVTFVQLLFCLKGNKGQDRQKRIYLDHMTASLVNESHASYSHANSVTMRSIKFIGTIAIRVTLESRSNISSLLLVKLRDRTFINFRGKKIRKPFTYQT